MEHFSPALSEVTYVVHFYSYNCFCKLQSQEGIKRSNLKNEQTLNTSAADFLPNNEGSNVGK